MEQSLLGKPVGKEHEEGENPGNPDSFKLFRESPKRWFSTMFVPNSLAGLTVSFPALSLGAAFGILARPPIPGQLGGGALKGIFSAGIIALITGAGGGTKVQCSGVTAPMATVFAQISAYAQSGGCRSTKGVFIPCEGVGDFNCEDECEEVAEQTWDDSGLRAEFGGAGNEVNPDAFLNTCLLMTGLIISLCGVCRAGRFIAVVPALVVSGFMNGIASLIWLREAGTLLGFRPVRTSWDFLIGFEGMDRQEGSLELNALVTFLTFGGTLLLPWLFGKVLPSNIARKVPTVLIVLVILTLVGLLINFDTQENRIELTDLGGDCEEDGGVCYPNDPGGECAGSVACYTLTEEECVEGEGQWTPDCADDNTEVPCFTILSKDECTAPAAGGEWVDGTIASFDDFADILQRNVPWVDWGTNPGLLWTAVPYVFRLVLLAYLDTILTVLVVDKLLREKKVWQTPTNKDRELGSQGVANGLCAFVGGVPGAQSTTVSVLAINEGGTNRIAGTMVGVFILIEMLLLQNLIVFIPSAVFGGILVKVGYDVMDWPPMLNSLGQVKAYLTGGQFSAPAAVTGWQQFIILGTTSFTVLWDLNYAVVIFTIIYQATRLLGPRFPSLGLPTIHDLDMSGATPSLDPEPLAEPDKVDGGKDTAATTGGEAQTSLTGGAYAAIETKEPVYTPTWIRVANPLSFVATALINGLGSAGVLSGTGVGEVSDNNPTLITPASFAFSIWGLIYFCLALFCVLSACAEAPLCGTGSRDVSRALSRDGVLLSQQIGWLFVASNIFNAAWIVVFVWNTAATAWVSTVLILCLEGSLIAIYIRAGLWRTPRQTVLTFFAVDIAFSLYLGWVTVATILNTSVAMVASGITPETVGWSAVGWACVMLSTAAVLALYMLATRQDLSYPLVLIWALSAIVANRGGESIDPGADAQVQAVGASLIGVVSAMVAGVAVQWGSMYYHDGGADALPPLLFVDALAENANNGRTRRASINTVPAAVSASLGPPLVSTDTPRPSFS